MKRMKIQCTADPSHRVFTSNVPAVVAGMFDEHGDYLKEIAILDVNPPSSCAEDWLCHECDSPVSISYTGLDKVPDNTEDCNTKNNNAAGSTTGLKISIEKPKAKTRTITFGRSHAIALMALVAVKRNGPTETGFVAPRSFSAVRTGVAELRYWNLVEWKGSIKKPMYGPTKLGEDFADNFAAIRNKVTKEGNGDDTKILSVRGKEIRITDCFRGHRTRAGLSPKRMYEDGKKCLKGQLSLKKWYASMGIHTPLHVPKKDNRKDTK